MATTREPRLRGMSVEPRPMAATERAQFGLPPQIDDEVRARTAQMQTNRAPTPAPAAPTPGAPAQGRVASIRQKVGGMVSGTPVATPAASTAPIIPKNPGTGTLKGVPVGGTAVPRPTVRGVIGAVGQNLRALASPAALTGAVGGAALAQANLRQPTAQISAADYLNMPPEQIKALTEASSNESVGSATQINDARTAAVAPVAPAAPPVAPQGVTLPATGSGSGRGSSADPNRTDVDPTDPRFGAARDFSRELATVPRDLPADMRDGVILKTKDANGRTVYSGRNVGADAQMVDGMGRTLRGGGGTVSTVPGMAPGEAQRILARPSPGAEGVGGGGGFGGSGGFSAAGGLFDTPKARRAAETLRQGSEQLSNQRRGQDMNLQGIREGITERENNRQSLRSEKAAETAAMTARRAEYMRLANGDAAVAAEIAANSGDLDSADALSGTADKGDSRAKSRDTAIDTLLKPLSTFQGEDGKSGGVDEAKLQQNRDVFQSLASSQGRTVEELLADAPAARAAIKIINGINSRKDNGVGQMLGIDGPSTSLRQLPDFKGSMSKQVGFLEGAFTPGGVQRGDRRINLGDKQGAVYLPAEIMEDQDVQNFLRGRGVDAR